MSRSNKVTGSLPHHGPAKAAATVSYDVRALDFAELSGALSWTLGSGRHFSSTLVELAVHPIQRIILRRGNELELVQARNVSHVFARTGRHIGQGREGCGLTLNIHPICQG